MAKQKTRKKNNSGDILTRRNELLKFKFETTSGLLQTPYTAIEYQKGLTDAVNRMFKFYFRLNILKTYIIRGGNEVLIPSACGLTWDSRITPFEQMVLNDKNLRLKELRQIKK